MVVGGGEMTSADNVPLSVGAADSEPESEVPDGE